MCRVLNDPGQAKVCDLYCISTMRVAWVNFIGQEDCSDRQCGTEISQGYLLRVTKQQTPAGFSNIIVTSTGCQALDVTVTTDYVIP